MTSVPFYIPDVHEGFSEAHGMLFLEDGTLVFQMQVTTLELFKHDPKEVRVDLGAIDQIRFSRGWWRDKLRFRPKRFDLLAEMPGTHKEELKIKIKRKHRDAVDRLLEEIEAALEAEPPEAVDTPDEPAEGPSPSTPA